MRQPVAGSFERSESGMRQSDIASARDRRRRRSTPGRRRREALNYIVARV
jgi:hypothetical protein